MKKTAFLWTNDDIGFGKADKLRRQLEFLDELGIPGTFFVVPIMGGKTLADDAELVDVISRAREQGHDFHQHGTRHGPFECGVPETWMLDFSPDVWRTIKVTSKNDEFWVYVDGELQLHVTDGAIPSGMIGFDTDPGSLIHIDDVRVTAQQEFYVSHLLDLAVNAINEARIRGADTSDAEDHLDDARAAQDRGDLDSAESNAEEAIHAAETAMAPEDEPQQSSSQGDRLTWSVELMAGVVTIGAAIVGAAGWYYRTRSTRRRGTILFNRFLSSVDDVYSRFKMNSNRCEAELLRLKEEIFRDFKEGLIEGESFNTLDERIERYLREIREETERDQS